LKALHFIRAATIVYTYEFPIPPLVGIGQMSRYNVAAYIYRLNHCSLTMRSVVVVNVDMLS